MSQHCDRKDCENYREWIPTDNGFEIENKPAGPEVIEATNLMPAFNPFFVCLCCPSFKGIDGFREKSPEKPVTPK